MIPDMDGHDRRAVIFEGNHPEAILERSLLEFQRRDFEPRMDTVSCRKEECKESRSKQSVRSVSGGLISASPRVESTRYEVPVFLPPFFPSVDPGCRRRAFGPAFARLVR